MSGHSKWSTIKHKKGAADAKRGKIFTKIIKEITIAARMGGGDIESNPRLRTAIHKARSANMPKDNIERAIKKGIGDSGGVEYMELSYEGYGPGGVAIMVQTLTDNKNRTAADVRSIFTKHNGNLGATGCVSYLFHRQGIMLYDATVYNEDEILNVALEAGAEDVVVIDDVIEVTCAPVDFNMLLEALHACSFEPLSAEVRQVPETTVSVAVEQIPQILKIIDLLEDNDDVQEVASNLDIPENYM